MLPLHTDSRHSAASGFPGYDRTPFCLLRPAHPLSGDPMELGPAPTFQALLLSLQLNFPTTGPWFKLAWPLECSQPCPCFLSFLLGNPPPHPHPVQSSPWQNSKSAQGDWLYPADQSVSSCLSPQVFAFLSFRFCSISSPLFISSVIPNTWFSHRLPPCLLCPLAGFPIIQRGQLCAQPIKNLLES